MKITTSKIKNSKLLNYSKGKTSLLKLKSNLKSDFYWLMKKKEEFKKS
tara:strand:- start:4556 stop:4699 length:144 start_codon:yes stop_codon:yes gene_type:complete